MNERLRLLYVALTRAEKWLIVAMAGDLDKNGDSWYQMVEAVMTSENAQEVGTDGQIIRRLEHGNWATSDLVENRETPAASSALPEVFLHPAPPPPTPPQSLSPSDLGGAKALPGDQGLDEEAAMLRGTRIHLLLEHLPQVAPVNRPDAARNILPDVADHARTELVREVEKVLNAPGLAYIFAPDTLAEVPVTANLGSARMHGIIDRLLVSPDRVLIVDFKTNATVPADVAACPEGVLRQMGAYAMALAEIYPNHRIEAAILWTAEASLMPLPHDLVSKALARTPYLDAAHPRS